MASTVHLGPLVDFTHTRYSVMLDNGKRLVLFRLPKIEGTTATRKPNETEDGWTYFAMEAECPHAGGPMIESQVDIEDSSYIASCPWHAYDFNVETGESSFGIKTCTFPIVIEDGHVSVQVSGYGRVALSRLDPVSEKIKFKHGPKKEASKEAVSLGDDATLCDWCVHILNTADPEQKIELTTRLFSLFATKENSSSPMQLGAGIVETPDKPRRDDYGKLNPGAMPRAGKGGTLKSRIMMLHNLANIEQWAIDLAIDICVRFATFQTNSPDKALSRELPRTFYYDWLKVANDEAKHFSLLRSRLEELGSRFGALPVHHGLWDSAVMTAHDLRARISVIALVHEARGLDVNPMTIDRFRKAADMDTVDTLDIIHNDEITHVTTGHRWLTWICDQEATDPVEVFRENVKKYFAGAIKGPFNEEARLQAGMDPRYYENLGGEVGSTAHVIAGG
ncbi:hypothetical protein KJ359_004900 [Pestalotiopsis sp. 9143b]|nr:hypothetical protein KJ359_004900 [Pestalotiopsis sp. 9143b]